MALTRDEWQKLEVLIPEALALAPSERCAFLDRQCPSGLRAELDALLYASETGDSLLDAPVGLSAPEAPGPSLTQGEVLGAWRIDTLLGSGGMGEVYAAERADGSYEQRVAIKLLKRGIDTQAVLSRFLRERRILARLAHPNIARLLDAGAAADGRPYLVMERVDGVPMDQWCDREAPTLRRRLELMGQVCEAVYAAHREQVVHRDLKPSNVLVTTAGEVKLLDFGVSKLTGDLGSEQTQTVVGIAPMTPDYAAPEQVLGQLVTAATDVYALGLLLYRLLTGGLPHAPYSRLSLAAALVAVDREDRITRPSVMLRRKRPAGSSRVVRAQARELDGDLDRIVLKALQRDPARRYANAADLADDLRRHLDGRPVLARPDSRWYVARKFVMRNRVPVSAAVMVTLALVIGLTLALWQARIAKEQAQRAERVKNFVVSVFAEQDPFTRGGVLARTPQQMLGDAAARLDQELGGDPELHAELLDDLGDIQVDIGDLKSSQNLLERAVEERTRRDGAQSLEVAASLIRLARSINRQQHAADALKSATRALAILRAHRDADPLMVAAAENEMAYALSYGKGAPPDAERLYHEALGTYERLRGPDAPETLRVLYNIAQMHSQARQQEQAEAEVDELIVRSRRRYGDHSVTFARIIGLKASVLGDGNHPQASVDAYTQAIAILRPQVAEQDPLISGDLARMANQLRGLRRFDEAAAVYADAERSLTDDNSSTRCDVYRGWGLVELLLGHADEGERRLRAAHEFSLKFNGETSAYTWYFASEWGRGLVAQGKLVQAESVQRDALAHLSAIMGPAAYQNALVLQALADTLEHEKDRRGDAEAVRRQALAVVAAKYPDTEPRWAGYAQELAHNLAGAGTAAAETEGLSLGARIVSVYTRSAPDPESLAEAELEYAGFLDRAGQADAARQQLTDALLAFQNTTNPDAGAFKRAQVLQQWLGLPQPAPPKPAGPADSVKLP